MKELFTALAILLGASSQLALAQGSGTEVERKAEAQLLMAEHKKEPPRAPRQQSGIPSAPFTATVTGVEGRTLKVFYPVNGGINWQNSGTSYFASFLVMPYFQELSDKGFTLLVFTDGKHFWGAKLGANGYEDANGPFSVPPTAEVLDKQANDFNSQLVSRALDNERFGRKQDALVRESQAQKEKAASLTHRTTPPAGDGVPFGGILSSDVKYATLNTRESKQSVATKLVRGGFQPLSCQNAPVDGYPQLQIELCSTERKNGNGNVEESYQFQFFRGYVTHIEWRFATNKYPHYLALFLATYGQTSRPPARFEWEQCFASNQELAAHLNASNDPNERFNVRLCNMNELSSRSRDLTGKACFEKAANESLTNEQMEQCMMDAALWSLQSKNSSDTADVQMERTTAEGGSVARIKDHWFEREIVKDLGVQQ